MKEANELAAAAKALVGFEIVPGVPAEPPVLGPPCAAAEVSALRALVGGFPDAYARLLTEVGPISAIEAAGGFVSLSYEEVKQQLSLDYGTALTRIDEDGSAKRVFPIGTNSGGSYFLLANDDSGVWKYNVHMRPVAKPQKVASSMTNFLSKLVADWRAMAEGQGKQPDPRCPVGNSLCASFCVPPGRDGCRREAAEDQVPSVHHTVGRVGAK